MLRENARTATLTTTTNKSEDKRKTNPPTPHLQETTVSHILSQAPRESRFELNLSSITSE
jgi:hypothetical protein